MADKKKMTVAEMLAAARKADGQDGGAPQAEESSQKAADQPPGQVAAAEKKPAAAAATTKPGEKPSISDILAMARAGDAKSSATPPVTEEKPKPAAKEVEPKSTTKPAAKSKPAASAPAQRMTTASVLTAARTGTKRGPMTKAEAAEKQPALAKTQPKKPAAAKPPLPAMPEKPGYAVPRPKKAAAQPDQGRRSGLKAALAFFLAIPAVLFANPLATGMTALGTAIGLWCLALARFMFPNILTEPPSRFKIGFPDDFAPGQVVTKFKAQFGIWVVNGEYKGRPEIYALSTVCTHLGCTPNWLESEQKFKCPCHGSGFYSNGINFEGPALRPLERYAIRIADDGQLEVDKSFKFQEEMGQWADPASFVPV